MTDPYDLQRFVTAQNRVYDDVLTELGSGRKTSHWMWFVFPQLRGLGSSAMADRYGIGSRAEAVAYASHPVLGDRLRECARLLVAIPGASARSVFGSPDDLKLKSSMTLFARATGDDADVVAVLDAYYAGELDGRTLRMWDALA